MFERALARIRENKSELNPTSGSHQRPPSRWCVCTQGPRERKRRESGSIMGCCDAPPGRIAPSGSRIACPARVALHRDRHPLPHRPLRAHKQQGNPLRWGVESCGPDSRADGGHAGAARSGWITVTPRKTNRGARAASQQAARLPLRTMPPLGTAFEAPARASDRRATRMRTHLSRSAIARRCRRHRTTGRPWLARAARRDRRRDGGRLSEPSSVARTEAPRAAEIGRRRPLTPSTEVPTPPPTPLPPAALHRRAKTARYTPPTARDGHPRFSAKISRALIKVDHRSSAPRHPPA